MDTKETRRFTLAASFYYDHLSRCLPAGEIVKTSGNRIVVDLDAAGYDSLLRDAAYYVEHMSDPQEVDPWIISISKSAVRVLAVLEAAPWPEADGAELIFETEQIAEDARRAASRPAPVPAPVRVEPALPHSIRIVRLEDERDLWTAVCSCGGYVGPASFTARQAEVFSLNHGDRFPESAVEIVNPNAS